METTSSEPRHIVHSPEQLPLELPLAGPASRILAYGIDYALILILTLLTIVLAFMLFPLMAQLSSIFEDVREAALSDDPNTLSESNAILIIISFLVIVQLVIEWMYFVFCEMTMNGRSLGKAVVKLRVVADGGHPIGFSQSVARNLLRAVDILPLYYVVGLVSMLASLEGKRLGDLAAGTLVIRLDRPAAAAPIEPLAGDRLDEFRFDHEQVVRIGPDELRLIRQTLRRLPELSEDRAARALERTVSALTRHLDHEAVRPADREVFLHALLRAVERR